VSDASISFTRTARSEKLREEGLALSNTFLIA
jgi:hypothetical protein